jgi:hypothetical protein
MIMIREHILRAFPEGHSIGAVIFGIGLVQMRPMNLQHLIADIWVTPLLGVGVFVLSAGYWKSLDPGKKLAKKDYRTLFLVSASVTWFLYSVLFYLSARNLWAFSAVGFVTVILFLAGLLVWLIWGIVRAATPRVQAALQSDSLFMVATPQTSPSSVFWRIIVVVWGLLCIAGTIVAIFVK